MMDTKPHNDKADNHNPSDEKDFCYVLDLLSLFENESKKAPPLKEKPQDAPPSIGTATISKDGTLTLNLYANGPMHGSAQLHYKRSDADYPAVLKHIGDIKPGQVKSVRPWDEVK